jgi:hypothetical protein
LENFARFFPRLGKNGVAPVQSLKLPRLRTTAVLILSGYMQMCTHRQIPHPEAVWAKRLPADSGNTLDRLAAGREDAPPFFKSQRKVRG